MADYAIIHPFRKTMGHFNTISQVKAGTIVLATNIPVRKYPIARNSKIIISNAIIPSP
jgi:hypothetical protein